MSTEDTASTEKIAKIETFINEKLRIDLKRVLEAGDAMYGDISSYLELQNLLEKLSEMDINTEGNGDNGGMETMVDMGLNFYMKANIPSLMKLYVDVGLGFHVELTPPEALECIRQRIEFLNEKAEIFRKKAFEIRAQIRVSLETLRMLQNLDVEPRPDYRDVLL
nr:protein uxt [Hymenolepis microstoma]